MVDARDDWDRVSCADGSSDLLRHAAPQPVRLELVRVGLDADRRCVPMAGVERRAHRWIDDAPGACRGCRARPDGVRLRRACGPPRSGTRERRIIRRGGDARAVRHGPDTRRAFGSHRRRPVRYRRMRRGRAALDRARPAVRGDRVGPTRRRGAVVRVGHRRDLRVRRRNRGRLRRGRADRDATRARDRRQHVGRADLPRRHPASTRRRSNRSSRRRRSCPVWTSRGCRV